MRCTGKRSKSGDALNFWISVKSRVEADYFFNPILLHDREMHRVPRRQSPISEDDLLCTIYSILVHRQDFIHHSQDGLECRLDRVPTINGYIAMQDFLQNFRICDQPLALGGQSFKKVLSLGLIRMRAPD